MEYKKLKELKIPISILKNKNLHNKDTTLFGVIEFLSKDNLCTATNDCLSKYIQTSTSSISKGIARLKKENIITEKKFDGRNRTLTINYNNIKQETIDLSEISNEKEPSLTPQKNKKYVQKIIDESENLPFSIIGKDGLMKEARTLIPNDYKNMGTIYFLFKNKEIVYIGKSDNRIGRLFDHIYDKDFDSYNYFFYPKSILAEIEGAYILHYKPKYNSLKCVTKTNSIWKSKNTIKKLFKIPISLLEKLIKIYNLELLEGALINLKIFTHIFKLFENANPNFRNYTHSPLWDKFSYPKE